MSMSMSVPFVIVGLYSTVSLRRAVARSIAERYGFAMTDNKTTGWGNMSGEAEEFVCEHFVLGGEGEPLDFAAAVVGVIDITGTYTQCPECAKRKLIAENKGGTRSLPQKIVEQPG